RSEIRAAGQLVPLAGLGIVDVVGARQDRKSGQVADHRTVTGLDVGTDVAPPDHHRADASQELLEGGRVRVGVDLVRWLEGQGVDDVLDGANPVGVVDARLHRIGGVAFPLPPGASVEDGRSVIYGIRPEYLEIDPDGVEARV